MVLRSPNASAEKFINKMRNTHNIFVELDSAKCLMAGTYYIIDFAIPLRATERRSCNDRIAIKAFLISKIIIIIIIGRLCLARHGMG